MAKAILIAALLVPLAGSIPAAADDPPIECKVYSIDDAGDVVPPATSWVKPSVDGGRPSMTHYVPGTNLVSEPLARPKWVTETVCYLLAVLYDCLKDSQTCDSEAYNTFPVAWMRYNPDAPVVVMDSAQPPEKGVRTMTAAEFFLEYGPDQGGN